MTQSLILQLTANQEAITQIQKSIAASTELGHIQELTNQLDKLMMEQAQIRTVYGSWQINEAKRLEAEARGL